MSAIHWALGVEDSGVVNSFPPLANPGESRGVLDKVEGALPQVSLRLVLFGAVLDSAKRPRRLRAVARRWSPSPEALDVTGDWGSDVDPQSCDALGLSHFGYGADGPRSGEVPATSMPTVTAQVP